METEVSTQLRHVVIQPEITKESLTALEGYALRLGHPRAFFVGTIGLVWAIYYLWNQNWGNALVVFISSTSLALLSVLTVKPENIATTAIGKFALLSLNPMNATLRMAGLVFLVSGIWQHSSELILTGISAVLLGHSFGWGKLNSQFAGIRFT